jgi:cysteine synthase
LVNDIGFDGPAGPSQEEGDVFSQEKRDHMRALGAEVVEIASESGRVQCVGTAQCILGVSTRLRKLNSAVRIVAVEPAESAVLSGGAPGAHHIEGVGPGFVPPLWRDDLAQALTLVPPDCRPGGTAVDRQVLRRTILSRSVPDGSLGPR